MKIPERIGFHGNDMVQLKRQCPIPLSYNTITQMIQNPCLLHTELLGMYEVAEKYLKILPFHELHV